VSSHAVDYAAAANQRSAGPGATEMTTHVVQTAAACPNTTFVLGGYSQGASVTDIAIGLQTSLGRGETIPPELAPRVSAIVVFGNPLGLSGQTIEEASELYGAKTKSFCNTGDIFCGAGSSIAAHLAYPRDGSVDTAVEFAAAKVTATQSGAGAVGDVEVTAPEPAPAPQTERRGFWHRVFGF
jgi:cutinase